jgi:ubiquinone/menaquinone biosynthesis C-methylase UbiE
MLNNWFFLDDIIELWIKINQRGIRFVLSKFSIIAHRRTVSSFTSQFAHANWWIIPLLSERRNWMITKDRKKDYEEYLSEHFFKDQQSPKLVSLGCGAGNHEIKLANLNQQLEVCGYDLSAGLIQQARKQALEKKLDNVFFFQQDVATIQFEKESINYFLFNAALHHFENIDHFILERIKPALKKDGLIIINEYVGPNRLNLPKTQIDYCNQCLIETVSKENRRILGLNWYKTRCYRLGKLRMLISDPSECVDSESILPVLRREFVEISYQALGGNVLMPVLKHIAHHFVDKNQDQLLELISKEDAYLQNHQSDFVFAIYQKI